MSSQRYTRWRTADEEDDEDMENGALTETTNPEENESRRVFTLMTPSRDSAGAYPTIFSKKVVLLTVLLCTVCIFGGGSAGFYLGWTANHVGTSQQSKLTPEQPSNLTPEQPSKLTPPETSTKRVPETPTVCDHPDSFEDITAMSIKLMNSLSIFDIRNHTRKLSSLKPNDISGYIRSTLSAIGYKVKSLVYSVSTSYHPRDRPSTISILYNNGTNSQISSSFRTDTKNQSFVSFNGYSANGTHAGTLVYGYFAREADLNIVRSRNITLNSSILLVRQGTLHPAIQVRNAEKFGVKAVILYPDPDDFGAKSNSKNHLHTSLPLDGVITQSLRTETGDPATVGYTSEKFAYRLPANKFSDIPRIPVKSVSAAEAKLIFSLLKGPAAPSGWKGSVSDRNTLGGSFISELNVTSVSVTVFSDIGLSDVRSIHAFLPSEDSTKVIHVGTHFDESSADRISTSAVSVAAWLSFAGALKEAFPNGTRRMLVFSAFPGTQGDYSSGGEFSELLSNWIHTTAMAYIDFDDILKGSGFISARASPLMKSVVINAYHHVEWPNKFNTSVYHGLLDVQQQLANDSNLQFADMHEIKQASMCGESTNFYAKHGISTLNLAAVDVKKHNFYLKNSQYDELKLGIQLMDTDLEWTHMITSLLSVCSIILSNSPVPPVNFENYARYLKNEWYTEWLLAVDKNSTMWQYKETIEAITGELDILIIIFERLEKWYSDESFTSVIKSYRKREETLGKFMLLSRHFLRPSSVSNPLKGGSLLTFGPDVENSCESVSFPMLRKVLHDIKQNESTWNEFDRELSMILSAVSSLNTKFGSHMDS